MGICNCSQIPGEFSISIDVVFIRYLFDLFYSFLDDNSSAVGHDMVHTDSIGSAMPLELPFVSIDISIYLLATL